jgi:C4-dicarboxylate-specific signal transduction histidine kinase
MPATASDNILFVANSACNGRKLPRWSGSVCSGEPHGVELAHGIDTMVQLTGSIANEVSQPIAATVIDAEAALQWLAREPPALEEVRQAITAIVNNGNRAAEIVNRVRAFIKKAPSRKDNLEINDTIHEVIELVRSEANKNGIELRTELAEGLPSVLGDRVELQQVVLNLVVNAIQAMSSVGLGSLKLLIIASKADLDTVSVSVQDSGPGLAPANPERVFEAFYTTKLGGLGIGLSISRAIVETHGGRLWASASMSSGAIFHFTLPAHRYSTL